MLPRVLKNFNLFIDGRGYAGRVQEVTLPKLTHRTEEFKLGGLDTPVVVDMGLEKLETDITLSEYDPEIIKLFGMEDTHALPVVFRGSYADLDNTLSSGQISFTLRGGLDDETSGQAIPIAVYLTGVITELDFGQWKTGENASLRLHSVVRYYRLVVNGDELVEVDVENMTRTVNGINQIHLTSKQVRDTWTGAVYDFSVNVVDDAESVLKT